MTTSVGYPAGAPAWIDMTVPDLDRAAAFYGELFGWEFDTGPYLTARLGDRRIAGLTKPWGQDAQASEQSNWITYLATHDIVSALRTVREFGGTVIAPHQDIGDVGAMAIACEPAGAVFALWQPGTLRGSEAFGVPGAPIWTEVTSKDTRTTSDFMVRVFGYEPECVADSDFITLYSDGSPVCGIHGAAAERTSEGYGAWLTYFAVSSADAAAALVQRRGGAVLRDAEDSPHGRWAMLADPFGAHFAALEAADRA